MTRRVLNLLAALLALLVAGPAHGQEHELAGYWRELQQATTPAALARVHPPAAIRRGIDVDVVRALALVRHYDLTYNTADAHEAVRVLRRAVAASSADAWAHFGLGVALARGPDLRVRAYADRSIYFVDPHSRAAADAAPELRRALELDASLDAAALELGSLALDLGDAKLMHEAARALGTPRRRLNGPALLLAARMQNRMGEHDAAIALAEAALAHGANASEARHALAIAQFDAGIDDAAAADSYFAGIDALTEAGATVYYQPLRALVTPREAASWAAADLTQRRDWLRRFWNTRAALAGVPVRERLGAHFRRLADAADASVGKPMMGARAAGDGLGDVRQLGVADMSMLTLVRDGDADRVARLTYCGPGIDSLPPALQPSPDACMQTPEGRSRARQLREPGGRLRMAQAQNRALRGEWYYPPYSTHSGAGLGSVAVPRRRWTRASGRGRGCAGGIGRGVA